MLIVDFVVCLAALLGVGYLTFVGAKATVTQIEQAAHAEVSAIAGAVQRNTAVQRICDLMRERGSEWTFDDHHASHYPTGIRIWIANGQRWCAIKSVSGIEGSLLSPSREGPPDQENAARLWASFQAIRGALDERRQAKVTRAINQAIDKHLTTTYATT